MYLFIDFLLFYSLGLVLPILIRYVIFKRRLSRIVSILLCIVVWISNLFIFQVVLVPLELKMSGASHFALIISVITFYNLISQTKEITEVDKLKYGIKG